MELKLTRRKALALLAIVGVVAAGAGAGTMAYFSDTQHSNNNVVSAGTLDLQLGNGNGGFTNANRTLFHKSEAKPGDHGSKALTIKNNGTIKGNLSATFSVTGKENGYVGPEPHHNNSGKGQLVNKMQVRINGTGVDTGWTNASNLTNYNGEQFGQLAGGNSDTLNVYWKIPSGTGNVIQSDSATINSTVTLKQDRSA